MRIRILRKPTVAYIDGVRLDQFRLGAEYQLGHLLAGVFLAEGWAEPVDDDPGAAEVDASRQPAADVATTPPNLTRDFFPPYYDGSQPAVAAERSRRRARRPRQ